MQQADALAVLLAERSPRRILSSPSWRCVQSVGPLAGRTGLSIERTATLSKDMELGDMISLIADPNIDEAVLCTHGEVMQPLLAWLHARDPTIDADDPNQENLLRKGTAWVIELTGSQAHLRHLTPDAPVDCAEHLSAE